MSRRTPAFNVTAAALLVALFAAGCSNKSDNVEHDPSKGNSNGTVAGGKANGAPSGNGHSSGTWRGKLTTDIGGLKELQELIESHRGKVVVLDMWSTWCGPCKKELPGLAQLQKTHGDKVVCVAVDLDYDGSDETKPEKMKSTIEGIVRKRFGTVLKQDDSLDPAFRLFIANEADETIGEAFGHGEGVPVIFVYSKSGKRTKIDVDSVKKLGAKEISYEKHINPLVETLLKETGSGGNSSNEK